MKKIRPYPFAAIAAFGILAIGATIAWAETATLEIKRLSDPGQAMTAEKLAIEQLYRFTRPQMLNAIVKLSEDPNVAVPGMKEQLEDFKKLVTKEPEYESKHPFRGIAKLGTRQYAFALDVVPEKGKENEAKEEPKEDEKAEKKETQKTETTLNEVKPEDGPSPEDEKAVKGLKYNRLYFDLNGNGDLTDDKAIEAQNSSDDARGGILILGGRNHYAAFNFPQIDLTIDAGGTPVEYAFSMSGTVNGQKEFCHVNVRISAAAYREGDITLDEKKHHVALIDFNSNGRFDDVLTMRTLGNGDDARMYPEQGDVLLLDPDPKKPESPYDLAGSRSRNFISKMVNVDGRFYDLKVAPGGEKITFEPTAAPLGKVSNPNETFTAMIYGDQGIVRINGGKDNPASVPAGEWKLLAYQINLTPEPEKQAEEAGEKKDGEQKTLSEALKNVLSNSKPKPVRPTLAAGQATAGYKAVKVVAGETVEMPFGPPYKPVVKAYPVTDENKKVTRLSLSLVGLGGENCSNLMVKGNRPPKPEFTITDPDGKEVQTGTFEYG